MEEREKERERESPLAEYGQEIDAKTLPLFCSLEDTSNRI